MSHTPRHPPTPRERRIHRRRWLWRIAAALWLVLLVSFLDRWIYLTFNSSALLGISKATLESRDWYHMFRQAGYLGMWMVVALALMAQGLAFQRARRRRGKRFNVHAAIRPGLAVFLAAGLSGLVAELVKEVIRRQRPVPGTGEYAFDWFHHGVRGLGHGVPSSHAAVAFGGAFLLAYVYPGSRPVVLAIATGCAITRILAGAHFATDVLVAAMLSYAVARAMRPIVRSIAMDAELVLPDGPRLGLPITPPHSEERP